MIQFDEHIFSNGLVQPQASIEHCAVIGANRPVKHGEAMSQGPSIEG